LKNPSPRWWVWLFIIVCIWSVGYWIVYPAWPTISGEGERGGTKGTFGWTEYDQLKEQQADIMARKSVYLKKFKASTFKQILNDQTLFSFAIAGGKAAFKDNCATCHRVGGAGAKGFPNLNDDSWLWGGSIDAIYNTIKYGIRSTHEDTRTSVMPEFADVLTEKEIDELATYVLSLSNKEKYSGSGIKLYRENCAICHGDDGKGKQEVGAPNLTANIWLYSDGSKASMISQIRKPKHGIMPTWLGRLDDDTIRQLTVYVHSLGGGE